MRVLVVGSGGREHAIVAHLVANTPGVEVFAAPGNPGIGQLATLVGIAATDATALAQFAETKDIEMAIVGPEMALAAGVANSLREVGVKVLGPNQNGSRVETSKLWTKQLLMDEGIPTAIYKRFVDSADAIAYCEAHVFPLVVKADGLAAGKGAVVCETMEEARTAIVSMLDDAVFGDAGSQILVEDFLVGEEFSMMVFTDGQSWKPMPISQDHKRALDDDQGPNTGGMGAYAPVPQLVHAPAVADDVIFAPFIDALRKRDIDYRGVLTGNLIWTADGPFVIEFNCRFGDPEVEVTLPLLETDLTEIVSAIEAGTLGDADIRWSDGSALCVVMAAANYPATPRTGDVIKGLDAETPHSMVLHAGTTDQSGDIVTSGGRVLLVTATGHDFFEARENAYTRVATIEFDGMQFRKDIGHRAAKALSTI